MSDDRRREHRSVASDKRVCIKRVCIYIADNADLIAEHARRSGFPATTVTEVGKALY